MATDAAQGKRAEFWAIIGARLDTRLAALEKERARIEGWIQGRFREGAANE